MRLSDDLMDSVPGALCETLSAIRADEIVHSFVAGSAGKEQRIWYIDNRRWRKTPQSIQCGNRMSKGISMRNLTKSRARGVHGVFHPRLFDQSLHVGDLG